MHGATPAGAWNWAALAGHGPVLARRVGDRNEWWVAVGLASPVSEIPFDHAPCFGFAGYDLKNELERLRTSHAPADDFPVSAWWTPRFIFHGHAGHWEAASPTGDVAEAQALLELFSRPSPNAGMNAPGQWELDTPPERYLAQVRQLLAHIKRGDIYEVNYCIRRSAPWLNMDPCAAFARLLEYSDAPHAAFLQWEGRYALCASPERFLRIEKGRITGQPMKGTRPRSARPEEDARLARELASDAKERSENVMAVDVARNDFGRIARTGTVEVPELCAVKTFARVHQMVSTVTAGLLPGTTPMEVLRATFPMASMTGAPKVRAMQLIDEVEDMGRGLYSGTIGFFMPDGTADLNVVIRTIIWDRARGMASLITGGAITAGSHPLRELEECEQKALSVLNAFAP